MKTIVLIATAVFIACSANCDTVVILPSEQRFIDNEQNIHVETSIPGEFATLEGVLRMER